MKPSIPPVLITFALVCFALVQNTQAVNPPPDGGYPGGNTAEGQNALLSLTSGTYNTAVGFSSLKSNTSGTLNTAIGVNALSFNNVGNYDTANGVNALYTNTTGSFNTANGVYTLFRNSFGSANTATGAYALFYNTGGNVNTANGVYALFKNTTGQQNTATGEVALFSNITGDGNTAIGYQALLDNVTGAENTAVGEDALSSNNGNGNTALGTFAGAALTTGDNNIDIGNNVLGVAGESNTIRIGNTDITNTFIGGISGTTVASGAAVLVDSNGHLGTVTSSKRFKEEIKPMNKTSEAIFSLEPVTFRYKREVDPAGTSQFGLIAEEVAKVNPNLVARDKNGEIYTVRYEAVNAMLLNEFLKEHRKVQELVKEQALQIQKVSGQLEASKPQTATGG